MQHAWIPNSSPSIKNEMLKAIGVRSIDELYSDIPDEVLLSESYWNSLNIGFGRPLDEVEVYSTVTEKLSRLPEFKAPPFMGGGLWPHYVPAAVSEIVRRGEFLTAYTPYQAEISQGLLQALFEYQSLMADLLDMDVVNSSMYDWPSALGEAALMAVRVKGVRRIVVPETINPFHLRILETYVRPQGILVDKYRVDMSTGYADLEDLKAKAAGSSAVYIEYPYTFTGVVDINAKAVGEIAHDNKALYIVGVNPIALGLYKPPGELGADISVGEGQPLGLGLNYGGSTLGILATRWDGELIRQMPGRIIGMTQTKDGSSRAFVMILQTREQHIRRSKATSNITTNAALHAIAAAAYLALLGPKGIRELAEGIWYRSHYAANEIRTKAGLKAPALSGEFFGDFIVETPVKYEEIFLRLLGRGLLAGIAISKYAAWAKETWGLLSFTELHSKSHIDALVENLREVAS